MKNDLCLVLEDLDKIKAALKKSKDDFNVSSATNMGGRVKIIIDACDERSNSNNTKSSDGYANSKTEGNLIPTKNATPLSSKSNNLSKIKFDSNKSTEIISLKNKKNNPIKNNTSNLPPSNNIKNSKTNNTLVYSEEKFAASNANLAICNLIKAKTINPLKEKSKLGLSIKVYLNNITRKNNLSYAMKL